MKKEFVKLSLVAALFASAGMAQADVGVTVDAGTSGLGLHLSVPVRENLNARLGFNYLNYSYTGNTSDVDYDFKLKLQTLNALVDWFPMDGAFRVSAGVAHNGNKITTTAKSNSTGTYVIQGNTYNAASVGKVDGTIDFNKVAPYLGIGWGNAVAKEKGWGFSSDIGVLFQGSPNSALSNSGCSAPANVCAQLKADLLKENVSLNDEIHNIKFYPVIRIGVSYKF